MSKRYEFCAPWATSGCLHSTWLHALVPSLHETIFWVCRFAFLLSFSFAGNRRHAIICIEVIFSSFFSNFTEEPEKTFFSPKNTFLPKCHLNWAYFAFVRMFHCETWHQSLRTPIEQQRSPSNVYRTMSNPVEPCRTSIERHRTSVEPRRTPSNPVERLSNVYRTSSNVHRT